HSVALSAEPGNVFVPGGIPAVPLRVVSLALGPGRCSSDQRFPRRNRGVTGWSLQGPGKAGASRPRSGRTITRQGAGCVADSPQWVKSEVSMVVDTFADECRHLCGQMSTPVLLTQFSLIFSL